MGPKLGHPVDDHPGSPDAESRPQGTVFGGATPQAKPACLPATVTTTSTPARRWDARMGQKLGCPLDDHAGSPDAESRPERRWGGLAWIFKNIFCIYMDFYEWILLSGFFKTFKDFAG
jgi:hypothetical protein